MKRTGMQDRIKVMLFAAVVLAACLFASPAHAQWTQFQGTFTLTHETRWGRSVIPAGEYRLTLVHDVDGSRLIVQDAKNLKTVAQMISPSPREGASGASALLVSKRGAHQVVESLGIAELGESFVFERALTRIWVLEQGPGTGVSSVALAAGK